MDLHLSGIINGSGIISYSSNDLVPYRKDTVSDCFDLVYEGEDWYTDSCIVKYKPITAGSGELLIDYSIYTSQTKNKNAPNR